MTYLDVLSEWLHAYGGIIPFFFAMAVFAGMYTMLSQRLVNSNVGQRRALAIFCLASGLIVGNMMGKVLNPPVKEQTQIAQEKPLPTPEAVQPHNLSAENQEKREPSSAFPRIIVAIAFTIFTYYSIPKKVHVSDMRILQIASAVAGTLFAIIIPPVSIVGSIFFCVLLWFAYRVLILKTTAIPAQWRRNIGAYAGKFRP